MHWYYLWSNQLEPCIILGSSKEETRRFGKSQTNTKAGTIWWTENNWEGSSRET